MNSDAVQISLTNDGCGGYFVNLWRGDATNQERFGRFADVASASWFARAAAFGGMTVIDRTGDHLLG